MANHLVIRLDINGYGCTCSFRADCLPLCSFQMVLFYNVYNRVHCRFRKRTEEEIRVKIEEDMKQESDRREKEERERYPRCSRIE